jgi:hypothetical protein
MHLSWINPWHINQLGDIARQESEPHGALERFVQCVM